MAPVSDGIRSLPAPMIEVVGADHLDSPTTWTRQRLAFADAQLPLADAQLAFLLRQRGG